MFNLLQRAEGLLNDLDSAAANSLKSTNSTHHASSSATSTTTATNATNQRTPSPPPKNQSNNDSETVEWTNAANSTTSTGQPQQQRLPQRPIQQPQQQSQQQSQQQRVSDLDLAAFLNAPPTPPSKVAAKPTNKSTSTDDSSSVASTLSASTPLPSAASHDDSASLRDRVRVLTESVAALDKSKREMADTLDASLQQIKQLQAEMLAKDKKLAKLRSVEQLAGDQVAQMRADSSSAQTQLEALRRDVMASEARVRELAASLSAADQRANEAAVAANDRVAAVRRRAEDAEAELEKITTASRSAAALAERRVDEAAAASSALSDTAAHLQRTVDLLTARNNDVTAQLSSVQAELETTQHDFAQYKLEAHQVLARTAAEKSASAAASSSSSSPDDEATISATNNAVASELAAVRAHCGELERQLREARAAESEAKRVAARDAAAADAAVQEAESAVNKQSREARALREQLALETESANQRALSLQAEIDNLVQRARAADQEVQSLRQQLSASMVASSSDAGAAERQELENRLRTMTEHLIGKQNQIETLTSERSYLQLKLEQEQQQRQALEKFQKSARQAAASSEVRVRSIASLLKRRNSDPFQDAIEEDLSDDEIDTVVVNLESASPSVPPGTPSKRAGRSFVRKNAISVANALDALSSIAGRFLSLSPLARLFVIIYVVLLHSWVAYIVYSYQPEVHGKAEAIATVLNAPVSSELNLSHNKLVGLPHQA